MYLSPTVRDFDLFDVQKDLCNDSNQSEEPLVLALQKCYSADM